MFNEFIIFDKYKILKDVLFDKITELISKNESEKRRELKILSCYFSEEKILDEFKKFGRQYGIKIELILTRHVFNQYEESLKKEKDELFQAYPINQEKYFHGKALAYFHGDYKLIKTGQKVKSARIKKNTGLLLVTSANFSKQGFLGDNVETGVLLNDLSVLRTFIVEFENLKGIESSKHEKIKYTTDLDVFMNGFMLFKDKDDSFTLDSISSLKLKIKKNINRNRVASKLGGKIDSGNLVIHMDEAGYLNIKELTKFFSMPSKLFKKYSFYTPFGYWINKDIYNHIEFSNKEVYDIFLTLVRENLTSETIDRISNDIKKRIIENKQLLNILEDNNHVDLVNELEKWRYNLIEKIQDDEIIKKIFWGFDTIEFPLDPDSPSAAKFIKNTLSLNFKTERKTKKFLFLKPFKDFLEKKNEREKNSETLIQFIEKEGLKIRIMSLMTKIKLQKQDDFIFIKKRL